MLYVSVVLTFVGLITLFYALMLYIKGDAIKMNDRLEGIQNIEKPWLAEGADKHQSLGDYILKSVGHAITQRTSENKRKKQQRKLEQAGVLETQTYEQFMARKLVIFLVGGLGSALLVLATSRDINNMIMISGSILVLIMVCYRFYISKKMTKRKDMIIKALPYTLDLITVSVEAGLSLDGALGRIVMSVAGPLSYEFNQTLKEMRMGISKKEALTNMSERVDDRDVSMLLSSMIQADELGVSLSKILRIEGAQLREKRQQAAKEKAMKAPVKMLFPLMFFIFPTIFVIILAPAFIQMSQSF